MASRYILCQRDPGVLPAVDLLRLTKLLARSIVHHLEDYAVVIDLTGAPNNYTSTLFVATTTVNVTPGLAPITIAAVEANTTIALNGLGLPNRTVHFLVVDNPSDPTKVINFMNGVPAAFDVVTRVMTYAQRFLDLQPIVQSWLKTNGRAMPAILLPQSITGNAGALQTYTLDNGFDSTIPPPIPPPERDSCRMRFDVGIVNAINADTHDPVPAAIRSPFERWARTITWRRVGICISGGGATTFRLVPLLRQLELAGLPIDLLSGVSGGTILSTCYAVGGIPKVFDFADKGWAFTARLAGALVWSGFVQRFIDNFFGDCGVCNTEIRVVPLSMRIAPLTEPQPTYIVDGTFGQAARASGGAPIFAPYKLGNARLGDGAIIAGLPPPFLAERFGADIVFAMNVLALPETRFPGEDVPILGTLMKPFYEWTPLGRVADTMGATVTMLHTISEGSGWLADQFYDAPPYNFAAVEQPLFFNATDYANDGPKNESALALQVTANDWVLRWRALA